MKYLNATFPCFLKSLCIVLLFQIIGFTNAFAQDTIPNADFEYWTPASQGIYPVGYTHTQKETNSCPLCMPQYTTYIVQKDSVNVYHGNYSALLLYNNTRGLGYDPPWLKKKFAVQDHPTALNVYVKDSLFGPDTVAIDIKIFDSNNAVVDSGYWQSTTSIYQFQHITIPITTSSSTADSVSIYIRGGRYIRDTTSGDKTLFWVDDLSFATSTGGINDEKKNEPLLKVFPIPAGQYVMIRNVSGKSLESMKLYDMLGNKVLNIGKLNKAQTSIDVSLLPGGIYFLKYKLEQRTFVIKILKLQ